LAVFRSEKKSMIVGCKVASGIVKRASLIEIWRGSELIGTGELSILKVGKEETDMLEEGVECGISYLGKPLIEIGDTLQVYQEEQIFRKVK